MAAVTLAVETTHGDRRTRLTLTGPPGDVLAAYRDLGSPGLTAVGGVAAEGRDPTTVIDYVAPDLTGVTTVAPSRGG